MAENGTENSKHRNLASKFEAPKRGSRLTGMLATRPAGGQPAQPPAAAPDPQVEKTQQEQTPPPPPVENPPAAAPTPAPGSVAGSAALTGESTGDSVEESRRDTEHEGTGKAEPDANGNRSSRRREAGTGTDSDAKGPKVTSVYLTSRAYTKLQDARRKKFKDYAQVVHDAFAQIAKEAAQEKKEPDEVLASLFETPGESAANPWLMPESTTRTNSGKPMTEARISLSKDQREWVEDKMEATAVTSISGFLARVLEHHLLSPAGK